MIDEVIVNASRALRAPLHKKLGMAASVPESRALPGHWGVHVEVSLLGGSWSMQVSAATLRQHGFLPVQQAAPVPAWEAHETLADLPLQLQAQLGNVEIGIQDLLHLAEGDVIVLPQLQDTPVRLSCDGSLLSLTGALGASADRSQRSLRVLAS